MDEEISIPPVEKYGDIYIHANGQMGFIQSVGALIKFGNAADIFAVPSQKPQEIEVTGTSEKVKMVQWGDGNKFPSDLREKVNPSVETSSNLLFNILTTFGDGIKPVMLAVIGTEKKFINIEVYEVVMLRLIGKESNEEIKKLLQQNPFMRNIVETSFNICFENPYSRLTLTQCIMTLNNSIGTRTFRPEPVRVRVSSSFCYGFESQFE